MKRVVFFMLACLALLAPAASAQSVWTCGTTRAATTHNQADVQSAVNASSSGDCVTVPVGDGDVTWASPVTISGKCVQLTGPGSGSLIVRTSVVTITAATPGASGGDTPCVRVTGFNFQMGSGSQWNITASRGWRVDHNIIHLPTWAICWNTIGNQGSRTTYGNEGLIDNNTITNCRFVNYGEEGDGFGGNDRWLEADTIGTYHTIYLEDNIYTVDSCVQDAGGLIVGCNFADANYGGSYVARFNTLVQTYFEGHPTSGGVRGARFYEVYGNLMSLPTYPGGSNFCHWGTYYTGQGLVWFNDSEDDCSPTDEPNRWDLSFSDGDIRGSMGDCNGSNFVDSNELGNGWLCRDQPGAGKDASYWDFPTNPAPAQMKAPNYQWNNTAPSSRWVFDSSGDSRIAANRDFYNHAGTGVEQTSATSPFNGTVGTGWGTLARRPTTCTTGVGYFAKDQGSWNTSTSNPRGVPMNGDDGLFYRCASTNNWTVYYTPYTYPHPLQGAGGGGSPGSQRFRLRIRGANLQAAVLPFAVVFMVWRMKRRRRAA